jgi:hypothetical protein
VKTLRMQLFLLWAAVCLCYAPSLSGDFILDDKINIVENRVLRETRAWGELARRPLAQALGLDPSWREYRPVTALSHAAVHSFGGLNPFWHHLADIAVHAANACLVFWLAWTLLPAGPGRTAGCWVAAAVFALHPAQAESVSYISSARPNGLAFLLAMTSLSLHRAQPPRAWSRFGAGAALFAALCAKETAAAFLLIAAAHDLCFRRESPLRATLRGWLPLAAAFALHAALRRWMLGGWSQRSPWGAGWADHLSTMVQGLFQDLAIALWPSSLRYCYSFQPAGGPAVILGAAALAALALLAFAALRRRTLGAFGILWFAAGLLPVSNLIPLEWAAANRFLHLPLAGLALAAAALAARLPRRAGAWAAAALAGALLLPPCLEQQLALSDEFSMDLASRAAAPQDPCTALGLSAHYYNWGMLDRAESLARQALSPQAPPHLREAAAVEMVLIRRRARARKARRRGSASGPGVPGAGRRRS